MTGATALDATAVPDFGLDAWCSARLKQVEQSLERWVTADVPHGVDHGAPAQLVEAMRYAVLDGGKRLRGGLPCGERGQWQRRPAGSLCRRVDPRLFAGAR